MTLAKRKPSVPVTPEDFEILKRNSWRWWERAGVVRPCLAPIYVTGDRRDADVMFRAQAAPRFRDLWLPSTLWTDVRGARRTDAPGV